MQAQAWLKLRDLFEAASDLGEPERGAYLDRECAGDAGLRAQIERTPEGDPGESQFLRRAVSGGIELTLETSDAALEGTRLGSDRIVRKLGSGGMGTVYLAERGSGPLSQ